MLFDKSKLKLKSLDDRIHNLDMGCISPLSDAISDHRFEGDIAGSIIQAKKRGSSIILMIGAHVIREGVQNYIIDLIEKGFISCLSINGAVMIHDYEFALTGATTENVAEYISEGQFGLWEETGRINDIINQAYRNGLGMGEAVGRSISDGNFKFKEISLLAACFRLGVPVTVHVGIGYDIIHEHPGCNGAATGETSYRDFLLFTRIVENLEGGVVMNFGSAVMAPEVFLKALGMARNVAHQGGKSIKHFSALVCDLHDLPDDFGEEPSKDDPVYYFRPWKTMLVRTVADGGKSFYVKGKHKDTFPALCEARNEE